MILTIFKGSRTRTIWIGVYETETGLNLVRNSKLLLKTDI